MKMCLVEFLKTFLVKMKIRNNQKIKIIKSRFQLINLSLIDFQVRPFFERVLLPTILSH